MPSIAALHERSPEHSRRTDPASDAATSLV
jgi:hypothetical protein